MAKDLKKSSVGVGGGGRWEINSQLPVGVGVGGGEWKKMAKDLKKSSVGVGGGGGGARSPVL